MSDKLHVLPGGATPDVAAEELRKLRANIDNMCEFNRLVAKATRARYEALVDCGFTPEQALFLCK